MMNFKSQPKVFAVVLNYNGIDCLISCLDSLYASDYRNMEVIVIDNNSKDESFEIARKKFSKFYFIKNTKNIGFSAGNNIAIRLALEKMADYVLLLNNDAVLERNTVSKLVAEGEKSEKVGLVSPVIYTGKNNSIWFSGGRIIWNKMKTIHERTLQSEKPYSTEYASGCCLLIKKNVFREIGILDEDFFLYYEDADFSWRARKRGFDIIIVPDAICYHFEKSEVSNPDKLYWLVLSGLIFFKKNSPFLNKIWLVFYLFARRLKLLYRRFFSRKSEELNQITRAFSDFKKY